MALLLAPNMFENELPEIRNVWASNLEDEFRIIRRIVQDYNYIAMDTEFPGIVAQPTSRSADNLVYQYEKLRLNINMLKLIQLGLTFLDEYGRPPSGCSTWQFNFKFSLENDMQAEDSINLLINAGIRFDKLEEDGIDHFEFAELLMSSGVVLMDNVKFITFQGAFDFGYLVKMLTGKNLPENEAEFLQLVKIFFPVIYDLKYLMKSCKNLKGGLQEIASQVHVQRFGLQHQAGSDSLLTGETFFRVRETYFENVIDDSKYCGKLYGPICSMNVRTVEDSPNPEPSCNNDS